MLTRISKSFRWEMAHRLPFHDGGCRNVHGHSYSMTIELVGEPDRNGMVLDYFDMSNIVSPIIEEIDHSFLCDSSDELCRVFLETSKLKAVFVDFSTTAENIAAWMFEKLSDEFVVFKNIHEIRVVVQETERTSAEVSGLIRINIANVKVLEHQGHMLE